MFGKDSIVSYVMAKLKVDRECAIRLLDTAMVKYNPVLLSKVDREMSQIQEGSAAIH